MQKRVILARKNSTSALKVVTFILAILPLIALVAIGLNLVIRSIPAIDHLGLKLFSLKYDGQTTFGLIPALWGTFLAVLVAMIIATPASIMMAVLSNDFSFGFVSTLMRWITGVLSGIPPIIYAFMSVIFFQFFIYPKFAGQGLGQATNLPSWMLPLNGCNLLGGILLAFLIIPIMTPLIDDAFQNVPGSLKEASLALGANRWHTLFRVTFPSAIPGISNALILGILTAIGEAMIVAYAIGFGAISLPHPLFDVLQRVSPLTSTVAGLSAGSFSRAEGSFMGQSVSAFIGLLLLVMAFGLLGLATFLQKRFRKGLNP